MLPGFFYSHTPAPPAVHLPKSRTEHSQFTYAKDQPHYHIDHATFGSEVPRSAYISQYADSNHYMHTDSTGSYQKKSNLKPSLSASSGTVNKNQYSTHYFPQHTSGHSILNHNSNTGLMLGGHDHNNYKVPSLQHSRSLSADCPISTRFDSKHDVSDFLKAPLSGTNRPASSHEISNGYSNSIPVDLAFELHSQHSQNVKKKRPVLQKTSSLDEDILAERLAEFSLPADSQLYLDCRECNAIQATNRLQHAARHLNNQFQYQCNHRIAPNQDEDRIRKLARLVQTHFSCDSDSADSDPLAYRNLLQSAETGHHYTYNSAGQRISNFTAVSKPHNAFELDTNRVFNEYKKRLRKKQRDIEITRANMQWDTTNPPNYRGSSDEHTRALYARARLLAAENNIEKLSGTYTERYQDRQLCQKNYLESRSSRSEGRSPERRRHTRHESSQSPSSDSYRSSRRRYNSNTEYEYKEDEKRKHRDNRRQEVNYSQRPVYYSNDKKHILSNYKSSRSHKYDSRSEPRESSASSSMERASPEHRSRKKEERRRLPEAPKYTEFNSSIESQEDDRRKYASSSEGHRLSISRSHSSTDRDH